MHEFATPILRYVLFLAKLGANSSVNVVTELVKKHVANTKFTKEWNPEHFGGKSG